MRLVSWAEAILILGLALLFPYFIIFAGDQLFMYLKSQRHDYICMFKIEYFPYWFERYIVVGSGVMMLLLTIGRGLKIWLGRITIIVILLIWSIIVNTSFGTIQQDGVLFRSPGTYYNIQKISWKEVRNVTLELVRRPYGRSNKFTYGILNVKANNKLVEVPFSCVNEEDRENLIKVLQFLYQKDIKVEMHFDYSARSEILQYTNKEFLDVLRTITAKRI